MTQIFVWMFVSSCSISCGKQYLLIAHFPKVLRNKMPHLEHTHNLIGILSLKNTSSNLTTYFEMSSKEVPGSNSRCYSSNI